jgi:DNA adenine methylase
LAPFLSQLIVDNDLHDGTIAEPYAGGAGASLRLLFNETVSELRLNDADPRIVAFWKAVLNQTDALVGKIKQAKVSMRTWQKCRLIYDGPISRVSQLDLAFATFFLNRCNRSGIMMGGGPIGGYHQEGPWKLDARFNKTELIDRIERVASYRDRIVISKLDAIEFLSNLPQNNNRLLVFLDPPYYNKGQRLYLNSMEVEDHVALAKVLLNNPPFNWVLTYDNVPEIRQLYRKLGPKPFELSYSAYKRRVGKELVVFDPRLVIDPLLLDSQNRPGCIQFV